MFYVASPHHKPSPIFIKKKTTRHRAATTSSSSQKVSQPNRSNSAPNPNDSRKPTSAWILGQYYPTCHDTSFYSDYCSRIWCTYRRGLASSGMVLSGTKSAFSSDAGWGCMLRSGQMMLAETLVRHTIGRDWRLSTGTATLSTQHKPVLRMIVDNPNPGASPFSIQQLTKLGKEKYGKSPGDWYGPELFSQVIGDLMNGTSESPGIGQALGIQTIVARGSVVYRNVLRDAMNGTVTKEKEDTKDSKDKDTTDTTNTTNTTNSTTTTDTTDTTDTADTADTADTKNNPTPSSSSSSSSSSLFLLVPVRLGLRKLDEDYIPEILHTLELPSCVGIIGGRPGHSLHFIGSVQPQNESDVPHIIYLDPHFEQPACTLSDSFPR